MVAINNTNKANINTNIWPPQNQPQSSIHVSMNTTCMLYMVIMTVPMQRFTHDTSRRHLLAILAKTNLHKIINDHLKLKLNKTQYAKHTFMYMFSEIFVVHFHPHQDQKQHQRPDQFHHNTQLTKAINKQPVWWSKWCAAQIISTTHLVSRPTTMYVEGVCGN